MHYAVQRKDKKKKKRQRPKCVISGQFCTLAMFFFRKT